MNHRLEQLMKAEGLTSAKFAEILSVQPSSISHLLSGRNKPNFDFIAKLLLMFPTLNPRWIINGQLPMYSDPNIDENATELAVDYKNDSTDNYNSGMLNFENQLPKHQNIQSVNFVNQNSELSPADEINLNSNLYQKVNVSELDEVVSETITSNKDTYNQYQPSDSRSVQRVLLLYSDNSFEFFDNTIS